MLTWPWFPGMMLAFVCCSSSGRAKRDRGSSTYFGVYKERVKGEWGARLTFKTVITEIGFFDDELSAARE